MAPSRCLPCFLCLSLLLVDNALAEKANMSPEQLYQTATHVIEGQVIAVYQRTETDGDWKYTKYLAEVRIARCDKGEGIKSGELIYVRYWQRQWIGRGTVPPSSSGHRGLPKDNDSVRIYLAKDAYDGFTTGAKDGGYNVIGANGFQSLAAQAAK